MHPDLHRYDCLRANKATMAHGLEARVPFLDKEMLDATMRMHPDLKMIHKGASTQFLEKWILRAAFDDADAPYLPKEILWRQKEQFSDGVGYSWIDGVRDYATRQVTEEMWSKREERWPINPPVTKEAYLYREIFDE